jgi:hypothetical protein
MGMPGVRSLSLASVSSFLSWCFPTLLADHDACGVQLADLVDEFWVVNPHG